MNELVGVRTVAVNNCIIESFSKCQFHRGFLAVNTM
jgi:hypothetical protein